MKGLSKLLVILVLLGSGSALTAQNEEAKPSLDGGSIDSQMEYVIEESNNYQQYKVIEEKWIRKLRSHVKDTLSAMRNERGELKSELETRAEKIKALNLELKSTQDTLADTRQAQNEMAFVGVPLEKTSYRITMWSIIGILVIALLIFIYRYNRSKAITRQSRETLTNVQDEFDDHRKRALEREQKLRRELQDELNKQQRNQR